MIRFKKILLVAITSVFVLSCTNENKTGENTVQEVPLFLKRLTFDNNKYQYEFQYEGNKLVRRTLNAIQTGDFGVEIYDLEYDESDRLKTINLKVNQESTSSQVYNFTYNENTGLIKMYHTLVATNEEQVYFIEPLNDRTVSVHLNQKFASRYYFNENGSLKTNQRVSYSSEYPFFNYVYEYDGKNAPFKGVYQNRNLYLIFEQLNQNGVFTSYLFAPFQNISKHITSTSDPEVIGSIAYTYNEQGYPIIATLTRSTGTENVSYEYY